MTYTESIEFLTSLVDYERWIYRNYEFKLDNYYNFLERLGNPHKRLNRVVLVAGTKGKNEKSKGGYLRYVDIFEAYKCSESNGRRVKKCD